MTGVSRNYLPGANNRFFMRPKTAEISKMNHISCLTTTETKPALLGIN